MPIASVSGISLSSSHYSQGPAVSNYDTAFRKWYLDLKFPLIELFKETLVMPLMRPLRAATNIYELTCPEVVAKKKGIAITHASIAEGKVFGVKESKKYEFPSQERLHGVLDRTQELAKQMGINKEVHLYRSMNTMACGLNLFSRPAQLYVDKKHLLLPDEELDFVLCHELAHIKHNDKLRMLAFDVIACLVEIVAFPLIFPMTILFIEPAINGSNNYLFRRNQEARADWRAMQTLQSNVGAVNYWKRSLEENLSTRSSAMRMLELFAKIKSEKKGDPEKMAPHLTKKLKDDLNTIGLSGDLRSDFDHPPLTKRLATAIAFRGC